MDEFDLEFFDSRFDEIMDILDYFLMELNPIIEDGEWAQRNDAERIKA